MLLSTPNTIHKWQNRINKKSKLYLAEGDSWMSYPGQKSNIINGYSLIDILSEKIDICNFAYFGDTISNICKTENINHIKDLLSYILHSKDNNKVKVVLLSCGGNDLIDNLKFYINDNKTNTNDIQSLINYNKLNELLSQIEMNYIKFINGLNQFLNKDVKYVIHTYDYITNIGQPFDSWFTKTGPWIYPKMKSKNIIDNDMILQIMRIVIDKFYETLIKIQNKVDNIIILDMRGTIKDSKLYENEIHLSKEGMNIYANEYYDKLMNCLKY